MSFFIKELVKNRINRLTVDELLHTARDYGFSLSRDEATQIISYIRANELDIFSKQAVDQTYAKLAEITDVATADKAKKLFEQILTSYGLQDLFN